jgi:putative FmdB family regulatory protein
MPTYSYRCTECGTAFDIQQAFTDDSLTDCPTCGGRLRKLFNTVGVTFNGSGFYRTDSRPAEKSGTSEPAPAASSPAPASTPAAAPTSKD